MLADAIDAVEIDPFDYADLVRYLAANFPREMLDQLIDQPGERMLRRMAFESIRERRACPIHSVPGNVLRDWMLEAPASRPLLVAQVTRPWKAAESGDEEFRWHSSALTTIEVAADTKEVLEVFYDALEPRSWSGSRAAIMEKRATLLYQLTQHARADVAAWATEASEKFQADVTRAREWEDQKERETSERFEW
ncbi:hypothetical protein DDZ18_09150 [Marinicauda salina]|uniref:Uncharacterized protein n=1 Tax=Marinicauda salina TaxID=2135793 RepID=A0A2U2BUV1_9PROT|nr:hypothetical protein DDZ18_09150 [Marinicauda salina]